MTYKAQAISRELADRLAKRFPTLSVTEGFGTASDPLITISDGTPAAGEKVIIVRLASDSTGVSKDVLGLDAEHFTPHKVQICTEANPAGGAGADILAAQDILNVLGEGVNMGCKVEWFNTASTVVPSEAAMIAGNLVATYSDLYWKRQKSS